MLTEEILTLALQNRQTGWWRGRYILSLLLSAIGTLLFTVSHQLCDAVLGLWERP